MRAMSDAHEYEAIQTAFSELSEAQRLNLYRARKQHKLCTVFVHELAHTLGVPHELPAPSLMNPRYQLQASGLSDEASNIVRASLATRTQPSHVVLDAGLARTIHALLSAPNADWEPHSRDAVLARIAPAESSGAAPAATAVPSATNAATPAPSRTPERRPQRAGTTGTRSRPCRAQRGACGECSRDRGADPFGAPESARAKIAALRDRDGARRGLGDD